MCRDNQLSLKFVASLSLLYQIGTLLFIIIMGIVMGLNISDMLSIKRENERLIFDMNLLEHSLLEQKKYNSLITTNEQLLKAASRSASPAGCNKRPRKH